MAEEINLAELFEKLSPIFWMNGRLQTFEHWPFKSEKSNCSPENMAAAGFYAIGGTDEPDLAQCFICSKELDGWEEGDDPWEEHKKHQPSCPFITVNKRNELDMSVKELFYLISKYHIVRLTKEYEKAVEDIKKEWQDSASLLPNMIRRKNKD